MTELAYLRDVDAAYVARFRARVVALPPGAIVLDRTFFYPVGGGQPSDRGTLEAADGRSARVYDVTRSGGFILHRYERAPGARAFQIGDELEGVLDWSRRHAHMQAHSAQHLLSARLFALTGLRTRRATLTGPAGYVDLESAPADSFALSSVAEDLRAWIERKALVAIRWVPRTVWDRAPEGRSGMVPLPASVDPVRVVEIAGADACACGGTHVRSTAEIGPIEVRRPGQPAARIAFTISERGPPTPSG